MIKKCTCCNQITEIVYSDYEYSNKVKLDLCFVCMSKNMSEELKNVKKCQKCGSNFSAEEEWKKICFNCWKKSKNKIPIPIPI